MNIKRTQRASLHAQPSLIESARGMMDAHHAVIDVDRSVIDVDRTVIDVDRGVIDISLFGIDPPGRLIDVQRGVMGRPWRQIARQLARIESDRSDVDRKACTVGSAEKVIDTHDVNIAQHRVTVRHPRRPIDPRSACSSLTLSTRAGRTPQPVPPATAQPFHPPTKILEPRAPTLTDIKPTICS